MWQKVWSLVEVKKDQKMAVKLAGLFTTITLRVEIREDLPKITTINHTPKK